VGRPEGSSGQIAFGKTGILRGHASGKISVRVLTDGKQKTRLISERQTWGQWIQWLGSAIKEKLHVKILGPFE
jgi:hypothetical protein